MSQKINCQTVRDLKSVNRKILIISSFAPPHIHVATNRISSFIQEFQKAGYEVTVLTVWDRDLVLGSTDSGFLDMVEEGVRFIRLDSNSVFNLATFRRKTSFFNHKLKALKNKILNLWLIDDKPGFFLSFQRQQQQLNLGKYDIVLSSFAPLSSHLIAMHLKKENPSTKWIADFRDEMCFLPELNTLQRGRLKKVERLIAECADMVTAVSRPILTEFLRDSRPTKLQTLEVRNGFNFRPIIEEESQRHIFKWAYFGTFYGGRNTLLFFEAMSLFKTKNPTQKISIDLYCGPSTLRTPLLLKDDVHWHEKVSYAEVPALMAKVSVLFLVQAITKRTGLFSGKIFDYLAVNRPILALVDQNDVAAELVHEANAGYVVHHDENLTAEKLCESIEHIYADWIHRRFPKRNWSLVQQQSRENQASKLISKIKENLT